MTDGTDGPPGGTDGGAPNADERATGPDAAEGGSERETVQAERTDGTASPDTDGDQPSESAATDSDATAAAAEIGSRLLGERPVLRAVGAVVVLALLARLVALGARPAHWDEARVAYWALYAHEQGSFAYRRIIHGPFVQHASRWLFGAFGTNDTTIRIPVALVGGLLPAAALLFRERLKDSEVLALAVLLAANPVLLYYSRFMRSDVLVGAFMFVAFGLAVRLLDTRKPRYLYGIGLFAVLGIASKENALLYVVTWLGALGLLADRELDTPGDDRTGIARALGAVDRLREKQWRPVARRYVPHLVGAGLLSAVVFLIMFAPRGAGTAGLRYPPADPSSAVSLGSTMGDPTQLPALVDATWSQFTEQYGEWASGTGELTVNSYRTRLTDTAKAAVVAGAAITGFSLLGFVRERYLVSDGRPLVMLFFFAAGASLVGYPLGLSIDSGYKWNVAHVLFPLAVPAAVGLGAAGRWIDTNFRREDTVGRLLLTVLVGAVVVAFAWQAASLVYLNPDHSSNDIVQGAQPNDDFGPLVADLEAAAQDPGEGADVLIYSNVSMDGSFVRSTNVSATDGAYYNFKPICTDWPETLPLDWYLASTGVDSDCARSEPELRHRAETEQPPMVVVRHGDNSVPHEWLTERYEATTYNLRYSDTTPPRAVVYVRDDL